MFIKRYFIKQYNYNKELLYDKYKNVLGRILYRLIYFILICDLEFVFAFTNGVVTKLNC